MFGIGSSGSHSLSSEVYYWVHYFVVYVKVIKHEQVNLTQPNQTSIMDFNERRKTRSANRSSVASHIFFDGHFNWSENSALYGKAFLLFFIKINYKLAINFSRGLLSARN